MDGWRGGQVLAALRAEVQRPGAVTEGFHGVAVVADPDVSADDGAVGGENGTAPTVFTVLFRWRADPTTYAVSVPVSLAASGQVAPVGVWTGTPVGSLQEWVGEVTGWLTEEVLTGLVRRARRTRRGAVVHLDPVNSLDVLPRGYCVGDVHLEPGGDDGGHLARAGLDVEVPRRVLEESRLITWRHAYVDNARAEPMVGHAVLSWAEAEPEHPGQRAQLDVLQVTAGTPSVVAAALAFHGLRDAAEAGAREAVTRVGGRVLAELGFDGPDADGERVLALDELRQPDLHP